jgi:NAD(P)-dependent dehydrogenase (short-subunit alcohol dehydrogenase family)
MNGTVLIYGGGGAIGGATARLLHEQGIRLHLAGRSEDGLQQTAEATSATYSVGDVRDPEFFQQVSKDAGSEISGLLYAVGTIQLAPLNRVTADQIREDFEVNALGASLAVQAALPALKAAKAASVVLVSSVAASRGFAFHTSIGMAKAAVEGLTVTLAAELAPRIRVNAVAPSLTRSPLSSPLLTNEKLAESIARHHPLKRLGEPGDIASMAAFLLGSQSGWMTGQVLHVDGGRSTLPD